jgi:hypothetical protein|tara:strand:+ start:1563 stop:1988 length:426 start_codon:yes stop_codon:yes gene_type:complete
MGTQRDEAMERMVADTNDVQMFFMEKFSRLVGKVLTNVEIAMPSETRQYLMLKRALNRILYDNSRASVLDYFKGTLTETHSGEGLEYVQSVFVKMQAELDQTLDMAFTVGPQHTAVKAAVKSSVDEILDAITDGFLSSDEE